MLSKPYIKPIRQKLTKTWSWTWRCPLQDHPPSAWCGNVFDTWHACFKSLEDHYRSYHL